MSQPANNRQEQPSGEVISLENHPLSQHHVSKILDDVLESSEEDVPEKSKGLHHPMLLDLLLAAGFLLVLGAFTTGLFHMYLLHSAARSINEQNYPATIAILKGAPLPELFSLPGSDTEELLSQALYLDALNKIESGHNIGPALQELAEIRPGSKYFANAQELINDNTEPAPLLLQGNAEATAVPQLEPEKSLLEKATGEEN